MLKQVGAKHEQNEGAIVGYRPRRQKHCVGTIALEEAKDMSSMLETHRRLVETIELNQRLARLEAEQAKGTAR